MNLLRETIEVVERSGHKIEDIIFIGSEKSGHSCTWDEFALLANREYDDSYGSAEVARDLIIAFSDGAQLFREEYDGSEWWGLISPFVTPAIKKPIGSLFAKNYESSLAEINRLTDSPG